MTTTSRPPLKLHAGRDAGLILPPSASHIPKAVAQANKVAIETRSAFRDAQAQWNAAREELKAAPTLDQRRDALAVAAGQELPVDRLEDAARGALDDAKRRLDACTRAFDTAQHELLNALDQARPQWIPELEAARDATKAEIRDRLETLAATFARLRDESETLIGLTERLPESGYVLGGVFEQDLQRATRERVIGAMPAANAGRVGPEQLPSLLAALKQLAG